jgi:transcriptional antiterminator RfaH
MNWYCWMSRPRAERDAGEAITALGYPTYLPLEKRIQRRWNGKAVAVEHALFPRYGFVQFDILGDPWGEIAHANGVMDVLRRGDGCPSPVPDDTIKMLRMAHDLGLFDHTKPKPFEFPKAGTRVKIAVGPFEGFIGRIARARSAERIEVLMQVLGAERKITVPLAALQQV